MTEPPDNHGPSGSSPVGWIIRFCVDNKLIVSIAILIIIGWGVMSAPFDWDLGGFPRSPVPTDAIPDIGENQQIVFTEWPGRSPQDVEDQISYPLTVSLMGIPGVKTIRSFSMFGFSTVYVIFDEHVEFYWSRSRILEKLASLPAGILPAGVQPALGPDATALGQIFWYTLEGRDPDGNPAGGWDLEELRAIQDFQVRYALLGAAGISEVASVGGFVREYQIDVDPDAMRAHGATLEDVFSAVRASNADVGARTIEVNRVEYIVRGIGLIKELEDIEETVVKVRENVPIRVRDVANVTMGPALRRGALDKEGTEAVGGVAVVRYGGNPLEAIRNIKKKIDEIAPGLPRRTLPDGTVSRVTIVPFYDRTKLIHETLGTLGTALADEILITIIVVLVSLIFLRSAVLVSSVLPLAVLMAFIAMKSFGVDANIVALSGIAIAIGTIVDMGIVVTENILGHLDRAGPDDDRKEVIIRAATEVGGAVLTAVATTVISFLPVFTMVAAEGKLFKPLAFTKTFALVASIIVSLAVIPPLAHVLLGGRVKGRVFKLVINISLVAAGIAIGVLFSWWAGALLGLMGAARLVSRFVPERVLKWSPRLAGAAAVAVVGILLTDHWLPLGPEKGLVRNMTFVGGLLGGILGLFYLLRRFYVHILGWCLDHKAAFLAVPAVLILVGAVIWLGFDAVLGWVPEKVKRFGPVSKIAHSLPGLGKEFMPPLDEGSYLFMPTTMPHASIGEVLDVLKKQDMAIRAIPEVESVVGKLGRAETSLDPAPISMIETVINTRTEFLVDGKGDRLRFRYDGGETDFQRDEKGLELPAPDGKPYLVRGRYPRDGKGRLIPDRKGMPFRLWRAALDPAINPGRDPWAGIRKPDDIWDAIVEAAKIPGTTSAPRLQPIAARIVMLQSGMRAPMGVKIKGPDLETIEKAGIDIERLLKQVPSVEPSTVSAERIVGKPYIEIHLDRDALARHGASIQQAQSVIEVAIGGKPITSTVEGRQRYPVRVRYMRELRDSIESLGEVLVPTPDGHQIPLKDLADMRYVRGPQVIKSEDTFLVGYVLFDKKPGLAEVDVVEQASAYLDDKIKKGGLLLPDGVSYTFAGSYESQVRSAGTLMIVLPLALLIIFLILYLQFRSTLTTLMVFSGILVAWSGGFIMIFLYAQPWFLDFAVFGSNLRDLFQVHTINLSVAVWVGFLALFGIASDDGVIMATYLDQTFAKRKPASRGEVRAMVIEGARRRIRPALMTVSTTLLALIPVLTSTGRGSDIMVPMAIPSFGGMTLVLITVFVVPTLYSLVQEIRLRRDK
ncbi:MAG: efflux RND transporter permease subunit [Pseudomonadota bacterium]